MVGHGALIGILLFLSQSFFRILFQRSCKTWWVFFSFGGKSSRDSKCIEARGKLTGDLLFLTDGPGSRKVFGRLLIIPNRAEGS